MVDIKGGKAAERIFFIDRDADQPVYAQLAESLRQQILAGKYQPGEKLPSENMLVEMYVVSPMTVRRAVICWHPRGSLLQHVAAAPL